MNGIWRVVFSCTLTAIFTAVIGYLLYLEQVKVPKLDIHKKFESNYFSKPKFPNDEVRLIVNNVEKEKIGIMYVSLVNFSTKDLLDLPVTIIIEPENVEQFKVLAHSAVGEHETTGSVIQTKKMVFDGNKYYFNFIAQAINRVDGPDPGLQLRLLFEGTEEPKVKVSAIGIDTREYDIDNSPSSSRDSIKTTSWLVLFMLSFVLIVIVVTGMFIMPAVSLFSHKSDVKFRKKRATALFHIIKENNLNPELDDEKLINYVTELLYQERLRNWNGLSIILKWTSAMIPPNKEDHRPAI